MSVQPFDPTRSTPISTTIEGPHSVFLHVRDRVLMPLAAAVWKITSPEDRRRMLKHLWDNIEDDKTRRRFRSLREMLEEGFPQEESFLALAKEEDFDGEVPIELHPWVALYVEERQGVNRAHFSSEAFYRNYREAHYF